MATIAQAAAHVFLEERRFRELVDAKTISRAARGAYDLDRVREEYVRNLREVAAGRSQTGELDPSQEKARKDKEYADHLAMRNAVTRESTVLIEDVVRSVTAEYSIVRNRMLGVPGKLGGVLTPAHVEMVRHEIYGALEELSGPETPNEVVPFTKGQKPALLRKKK